MLLDRPDEDKEDNDDEDKEGNPDEDKVGNDDYDKEDNPVAIYLLSGCNPILYQHTRYQKPLIFLYATPNKIMFFLWKHLQIPHVMHTSGNSKFWLYL